METMNGSNPLENAVCFVLKISALGNSRKVNTSAVECDTDKTMIAVNKRLFDCPEFKKIKRKHGEIRQFVYSRSVPAFFLRDGVYMIRTSGVENLMRDIDRMATETADLVDAFIAIYPEVVADSLRRLGSLANPADYLSPEVARGQFSVTYQFVEFGVPGRLRAVSPDVFAEESRKLRDTFINAADSITSLLYSETAALMDHAIERLSGNGDGKSKIFRDSMVTNLKDFFSGLKDRNLTDNAALNDIADRCNALLSNIDPERLRNSDGLKATVTEAFKTVKVEVDAAMLDRPSRMIELD